MLRLNEACRSRRIATSSNCIVRPISVRPSSSLCSTIKGGDAFATREVLRLLGAGSGATILLKATTIQGEERQVAVRLMRMDHGDEDESEMEEELSTTIRVPSYIYIQLNEKVADGPALQLQSSGEIRACCSPITKSRINRARAVDLKLLVKCESEDSTESALPLPLNNSLLWIGAIIPVMSKSDVRLCTYRVERIDGCLQCDGSVWCTDETTSYEAKPEYSFGARLPPITETVDWLLERPPTTKLPPHPDISYWIQQFERPCCSSNLPPQSRMWHVVGDRVDVPIRIAADRWGYPTRIIRGLAATAFHNGHAVTLAGMADKLAGLDYLSEHPGPSVIIIQDVDAEFRDQDDRHRFWDVLSMKMGHRVLIVLHSRKEDSFLPEFQVYPTKHASLPDAEYAEYLWNRHEERIGFSQIPTNSVFLRTILRGRTEFDISCLHDRYRRQQTATLEQFDESLLKSLCADYDKEQRNRSDVGEIPSVHWDDVGGVQHVRREIMDAIELPILYPQLFQTSRIHSGILLYGPPGTGKTLVAKAVATECNLPFLSVKGPELLGSYVGESEANLRSIFAKARELASENNPCGCVLFFDELDSLAPRRGESSSSGNVMDRVVATLFSQLDNRVPGISVFCIGATNRPDLLDPALLRPGRFNRLVYLGVEAENQEAILRAQIIRLRLDESADEIAERLSRRLPKNLTGADLSAIVSGAVLIAMERLCHKADEELRNRNNAGEGELTIDDVLASWPEEDLQPMISFDDFMEASNHTKPSVTDSELRHYENLRDTYQIEKRSTTS